MRPSALYAAFIQWGGGGGGGGGVQLEGRRPLRKGEEKYEELKERKERGTVWEEEGRSRACTAGGRGVS